MRRATVANPNEWTRQVSKKRYRYKAKQPQQQQIQRSTTNHTNNHSLKPVLLHNVEYHLNVSSVRQKNGQIIGYDSLLVSVDRGLRDNWDDQMCADLFHFY